MGTLIPYVLWSTMAVMLIFIIYGLISRTFNIAETGKYYTRTNGIMPARIAFAAIFAFTLPSGYCNMQVFVSSVATWGVGLATHAYQAIVLGIGPDATPIYQPIIPETKTTVAALIQNELCRALANAAANNPNLVPVPTVVSGAGADGNGYITWSYRLSTGNATDAPICGTVTLRQAAPAGNGVVDLTGSRLAILQGILSNIRSDVTTVANNYWRTRDGSALAPLRDTLINQSNSYTAQLTNAASALTAQLRADFPVQAMRNGTIGTPNAVPMMSALGWTMAPAWYIEMGRLNGLMVASTVAIPTVGAPTYRGFGSALAQDLGPLMTTAMGFMTELQTYVATTDRATTPSGYGDLSSGATPDMEGLSAMDKIVRSLNISEPVLRLLIQQISPTSTSIVDPFASLHTLGQLMINTAGAALGLSALLSSDTASTALTAWNVLTFNFGGAIATVAAHNVISAFLTPVFFGLMVLLIPGIVICYVLPAIPVVIWAFGVLNWLIRFIVLMYGTAVWMLAHATMNDESFVGRGQRGWLELVALFFTPVLMLCGLTSGYVIFAIGSWFLTLLFYVLAGFAMSGGWLFTNILGVFTLVAMFVMTHVAIAVQSFRLIALLPEKVFALIDIHGTDHIGSHALGHNIALVQMAGTLQQIRAGVETGAEQLGALPARPPQITAVERDRNVTAATKS